MGLCKVTSLVPSGNVASTYMYIYKEVCINIYMCIYIPIYMHMNVYIHIYIHIYVDIYICK
jgi:hypothetical protein